MPPSRAPGIGIGTVLVHPSKPGHVLIGQRIGATGANTWALPGGHLEFGEDFATCAAREAMEETGLTMQTNGAKVLATVSTVWKDKKSTHPDGVSHYVTVFVSGGVLGETEAKIMEPNKCKGWKWIAWEELREWAEKQALEQPDAVQDMETVKMEQKLFPPIVSLFKQYRGLKLV